MKEHTNNNTTPKNAESVKGVNTTPKDNIQTITLCKICIDSNKPLSERHILYNDGMCDKCYNKEQRGK